MRRPNESELLAEVVDGRYVRAHYRYRAYEFTIEREGRTWWCHGCISIPIREHQWFHRGDEVWEDVGICHEAGFASWSRKSILNKLCNAVDCHIRNALAYEQVRTAIA